MTDVLTSWIHELGSWSWAVLGVLLLLADVLVPGIYLLWLGLAGLAVAVQTLLIPLPWQFQVAFFIVYSGIFVWFARRLQKRGDEPGLRSALNERGASLVGRTVALRSPILNGFGDAYVDDTIWRVCGPDAGAGVPMVVTGCDGATLIVEPAMSPHEAGMSE